MPNAVIGKPIFMTDQTFYNYILMWKFLLRNTIFMEYTIFRFARIIGA